MDGSELDQRADPIAAHGVPKNPPIPGGTLGSDVFRTRYNVSCAYVAGAMYHGIASVDLVTRMANAGLIGFFGSAGLSLGEIEEALLEIKAGVAPFKSFGMNLHGHPADRDIERRTVDLYLKHDVRFVEAAAFTHITPALVHYRLHGLERGADGRIVCRNLILAKASRPEVASAYMKPPPADIVQHLLGDGSITAMEAELAPSIPVSSDICVEADSGGHTDGGIPTVLLPAMLQLRDDIVSQQDYGEPICIGLAGGIGEPRAAASAFFMGADFILTGSINQCTVEAGTSDLVKEMLQDIDVQDTDYAPAGDLFETGAKVQVLRKGVFFPARARKLLDLYSQYDGLDQLPPAVRLQLEKNYFGKTLDAIWQESTQYLLARGRGNDVALAESTPKKKLLHIFKAYFGLTTHNALHGIAEARVNFQVHTGPALGAFNRWAKGTRLSSWRDRHVDDLAFAIMAGAEEFTARRFARSPDARVPVTGRKECRLGSMP